MIKIGILGAGISGLSAAKLLNEHFDVEILEEKNIPGGIARTKTINDQTYHLIGGHCFNSKYNEVLDFVFNSVLPINEWNLIKRNAKIKFRDNEINYPIEYSIKQIYDFDKNLAFEITKDFLEAKDDGLYANLEDWFRKKFGNSLAENYFLPYNTKIWNRKPSEMSHLWVADKLPIPDKKSFFKSLIESETDNMPHSSFYYPKSNNMNTFIDALANQLKIIYNTKVISIEKDKSQYIINGERKYDIIINTLPLNIIPSLIKYTPENILHHAKLLKYNKVTNVLWESEPTDKTWSYLPESSSIFHRYIHIGSFSIPKKHFTITEKIGAVSFDEIVTAGQKDNSLRNPIGYNQSDHAYVVFDENYNNATHIVKQYLKDLNIHTLGRFGEWEYYNMDVCIMKAIELTKRIIDNYEKKII